MFKAHRLCVSLNSRLERNKEEEDTSQSVVDTPKSVLDTRVSVGHAYPENDFVERQDQIKTSVRHTEISVGHTEISWRHTRVNVGNIKISVGHT